MKKLFLIILAAALLTACGSQPVTETTIFSKQGLIDQLLYEGFTEEEAIFGAESVGF